MTLPSSIKQKDYAALSSQKTPEKTDRLISTTKSNENDGNVLTRVINPYEIPSPQYSPNNHHNHNQPNDISTPLPGQIESQNNLSNDNTNTEHLVIPDWYRVGWLAQVNSSIRSLSDNNEELKHVEILESFISEIYYGSWYHNAAIIFFAVAASHYVTVFGGGWSSLLIILSICATYYQTSLRRTRREARGDISRELSKQRLFQDHETVDWLNNFLSRFWLIYEPVLSATIVASVDQVLVASTPTFLESIRMSTFTLGSKPPRIEFIRSHPETDNDVVVMDWKFEFTPNDLSDLTAKEALGKINPKIVLTIKFGKGFIGAAKDIVVENITFCGEIRIRIKLMNNFPHLQLIDLSFLEKPEFDFVLKPIGFDLNMIPGLSGFIESQVHATLGPMMYDPNVFTLNLEQMLAGTPVDSAIGVLQIKLYNARGLKAVKIGGGTPDPYVTFSVGTRANLDRTAIKHSTQNPTWNSSHFILLNSLNDILSMEVMDSNEVRKDTSLGFANFDLQSLSADLEQEGLTIPILHQGKPRGEVRLDINYHPCLVAKKLENGDQEPVPETSAGVARLILHQAKDLDYKRTGTSNLSPYAKVYLDGKQILKTAIIKRTNNPVYESFIEVLVTNKQLATFTVKMFDEKAGDDPLIGQVNAKLVDLMEVTSGDQRLDWFPLKGAKTGKVRMSVSWKGVLMAGAINGAGAYTPPIGVLKFWFNRAEDLKNVEQLTGGKSDPYVRVMRSGITLARTQIHNNNLDPEFDEIIYVPIHRLKDSLRLEVMDYQHLTKDRSLGIIDLEVTNLIETQKSDEGLIGFRSTGKKNYSDFLKQEGKKSVVKGRLYFDIRFKPFDRTGSDLENIKSSNDLYLNQSDQTSNFGNSNEAGLIKLNGNNSSSSIAEPIESIVNHNSSCTDISLKNEMRDPSRVRARNVSQRSNSSHNPIDLSGTDPQKIIKHKQSQQILANNTGTGNGDNVSQSNDNQPPQSCDGSVVGEGRRSYSSSISQRNLKSLSKEELLGYQSGIVVFNIMGGQIAKKNARLEFLFDDGYWPAYSTEPSKSAHAKWDETGESFIRELDWSRCSLKLNTAEKDTKEEVYAEYTSGLKPFLEECLDEPHEFVLEDLEGGNRSTVMIQCRYIPVPIILEPRESINNMGVLSVILENGKDLPSADRNGYSDPYVQFSLNGVKVFKSSVQKKTLNPKWNERFDVEVPSRVRAEFVAQVFDWDRVGASDKIGSAKIDLKELEPMLQSTEVFKLVQSDQQVKGQIQLKMTFRPGFITRSRQATSTFTGLGRVATGLGGTVLSTGAGVGIGAARGVGQVGGGVIKGVGGVGKLGFAGIRRMTGGQSKRESIILEDSESLGTPRTERMSLMNSNFRTPSPTPKTRLLATDFKLNLQIIGASGLDSPEVKAYVHVIKNGKSIYDTKTIKHSTSPVWEENCSTDVKVGLDTELELVIYDKKKLGRDKELGEIRKLSVWEIFDLSNNIASPPSEVLLNEPILEHGTKRQLGGNMMIKLWLVESGGTTNGEAGNNSSHSPFGIHSISGGSRSQGSPKKDFLELDPHGNSIDLGNGGLPHSNNSRPGSLAGAKSSRSINKFSLHRNR
ncbi:C2 domain-containing protein [Phakopsora pachyrhizi]|nr:C2 domain-containing protein [Phakopsora pachyrhizi]